MTINDSYQRGLEVQFLGLLAIIQQGKQPMEPKSRMLSAVIATIRTIQEVAQRPDLPSQVVVTLLAVANHGNEHGIPMADLVEITGLSASAVSRNVSRLSVGIKEEEGLGLLEVVPDDNDRRAKVVRLSTSGRVLVEAIDLRAGAICRAATGEQ